MLRVLPCLILLFLLSGAGGLSAAGEPGTPEIEPAHTLVVSERFTEPIGFYDARPSFSWRLPVGSRDQQQSAFQIIAGSSEDLRAATADLWDSGRVESDKNVFVPYEGKPLKSRERVYWRVRYWDGRGKAAAWSRVTFFELGLLKNADWTAQWIQMAGRETPVDLAELTIRKALYGVPGKPTEQLDVSEKLQQLLATGVSRFSATNAFAGGDPSPGLPKKLVLEYDLAGTVIQRTLAEGASFDFTTAQAREFTPEYYRTEFDLNKEIAHARLHITAKGVYQAHLNGQRVGDDYLAPGFTPYSKRIETRTYDVTKLLNNGRNALGAVLGEGWYAGRLMAKRFVYPRAQPALLAQLEVTYSDGARQTVATGEPWKATDQGPLRFSGIYDGERYDARLEMPGWSKPGYDDSSWSRVKSHPVQDTPRLAPKRHYPVKATEELAAITLNQPAPDRVIFDLGQNMVGWPKLCVPAQAGKQVTVRFAEMLLPSGELYTDNYRRAKSTDEYTPAADGVATWHPTFTFHGFRYVEVSGFAQDATPHTDWVTGVVLHSDFPSAGDFRCSHQKLNQLQQNIRWGQRGNYLDIPTDCPQRDERLGWTGDAQVFCPTSLFNYHVHSFWASWLESTREEQNAEGLIPHVVPNVIGGFGSPGWGDVAVVGPWEVYVRTGDPRILRDNYAMMRRWTAAYERQAVEFIVNRKGFGDWLQPYRQTGNSYGDTPNNLIATAHFGLSAKIMSDACRALGREKESARYHKLHQDIRRAFSRVFFDKEGRLITERQTQTGYLLALAFDLLQPELRDAAAENLYRLIEEADGHLRTGFLGTPLLAPVLDDLGRHDLAYALILKETYPSWFYSINQGATTVWERWNSYSHTDGFGNANMNSFNHYAYGAVGQWMYERMAGIAPDPQSPGYKHFFLQPRPGGPLTSAHATLDTMHGAASIKWDLKAGVLRASVTVPPNTSATFVAPSEPGKAANLTVDGRASKHTDTTGRPVSPLGPGEHAVVVAYESRR